MVEPINKAIAQGIPVVCIDNDAPDSRRLTYFGTDNYHSGYLAGEILGEKLDGAGEVGILTIPGLYSLDERQRGFEECIEEKYPGITVVAVSNDEADPSVAANIAGQMFEQYPNMIGLFGTDAGKRRGRRYRPGRKGQAGRGEDGCVRQGFIGARTRRAGHDRGDASTKGRSPCRITDSSFYTITTHNSELKKRGNKHAARYSRYVVSSW